MNLILNYEGFEKHLVKQREHMLGVQYVFKFDNNYGASVIKHSGSYGHDQDLWELGVLHFGEDENDWHLTYNTPITADVIGWLTDAEVGDLLQKIKEL